MNNLSVELASEIEPELNRLFAGKKLERIEWHDSHGDSLILHFEDGTWLSATTFFTYTFMKDSTKPDKLFVMVQPIKTKEGFG